MCIQLCRSALQMWCRSAPDLHTMLYACVYFLLIICMWLAMFACVLRIFIYISHCVCTSSNQSNFMLCVVCAHDCNLDCDTPCHYCVITLLSWCYVTISLLSGFTSLSFTFTSLWTSSWTLLSWTLSFIYYKITLLYLIWSYLMVVFILHFMFLEFIIIYYCYKDNFHIHHY